MNRAFIFPGQGSQAVGMGKDFYDAFPVSKEIFQQVDEILNFDLSKTIFYGPEETLTLTSNTQPALMATSIAMLAAIKDQSAMPIGDLCLYLAGHSLGEYTALCAADSLTLEDTTKLLQLRGKSMQDACAPGAGAMAACIGIKIEDLESIVKDINSAKSICQIANDNIEGQVVISGHNDAIDRAVAIVKDLGYKAIKLKVSGPFHSDLMKSAETIMAEALTSTDISFPSVPVISNVSARATTNPSNIRQHLVQQICGRVRWRETINELKKLGVEEIVEIGCGKVLTGMLKKIDHNFKLVNVGNVQEFEQFMLTLS